MESNGNSVKDAEKQITRVLFCGPRFPASHEYTIEYLQNHSHIKVKWNQYYMLFSYPTCKLNYSSLFEIAPCLW